ncbi:MAG: hypothetical protein C0432_05075 [Candidatus Puniceispirillum sp.]|nr:hypothetical protein [Candidatus Pelagibacter sp.]MBA4283647.1 hypothetical protein [Candidatus Puniceispirillum sp.]
MYFVLKFIIFVSWSNACLYANEICINNNKPLHLHRKIVNINAPKVGTLRLAGVGSFDNLNMFSTTGIPFPYLWMCYETLMIESSLEPGVLYPWLCSKVTYNLKSITFHLKKDILFHSEKKMDAKDIKKTFEVLKKYGSLKYQSILNNISSIEIKSPYEIVISFSALESVRLVKLFIRQLSQIPILSKRQLDKLNFMNSGMTVLDGTGPYKVKNALVGKSVELEKYLHYWAEKNEDGRGKNNFLKIIIDLYKNQDVCYQSFLAKKFDVFFETNPKRWKKNYNSSSRKNQFAMAELQLKKPWAVRSVVLNMRKKSLQDQNLRKAILMLIEPEYINKLFFDNDMKVVDGIISVFKKQTQPEDLDLQYFQHSEFDSLKLVDSSLNQEHKLLWKSIVSKINVSKKYLLKHGYSFQNKILHDKNMQPVHLSLMLKDSNLLKVAHFLKFLLQKIGIMLDIALYDSIVYESAVNKLDFDLLFYSWLQIDTVDLKKSFEIFKSINVRSAVNIAGISDVMIDEYVDQLYAHSEGVEVEKILDHLSQKIKDTCAIKTLFSDNKVRIMYWPDLVSFPRLHPAADMNIMSRGWHS